MESSKRAKVVGLLAVGLLSVPAAIALAGSHTWDVNEVFSDSTGTIQFIELREMNGTPGETGVNGHLLLSSIESFTIPGPALAPPTSNKHLLFATPAAAALPGFPTPNYIFSDVAPDDEVPFFRTTTAEFIEYDPWDTLSWGAGALPLDGIHSLNGNGVVVCSSPTNYAGVTGSVNLNCPMLGDVNDDGAVDGLDVHDFVQAKLGGVVPNAACAEYCTGSLNGDIIAFVDDLLS